MTDIKGFDKYKECSMKASEIIASDCCGVGLPLGLNKHQLADKVEKLERDNKFLLDGLKKIQTLPNHRIDEFSQIAFKLINACK